MISNIFERRNPVQRAKDELKEAELALLEAETNSEYWEAQSVYNRSRIERLTTYVSSMRSTEQKGR
jgi:hypothetical protein